MTKLASNVSQAAQIALEKQKYAQRRRLKEDSHAVKVSHEISDDISPQSQVTFETVSGDISPLSILKNHEPSLEPSHVAHALERVLDFREDYAQTTPMPATIVKSTDHRSGCGTDPSGLSAQGRACRAACRAIRRQLELLMKGGRLKSKRGQAARR